MIGSIFHSQLCKGGLSAFFPYNQADDFPYSQQLRLRQKASPHQNQRRIL